jgi:hypothetical protein
MQGTLRIPRWTTILIVKCPDIALPAFFWVESLGGARRRRQRKTLCISYELEFSSPGPTK